MAAPVRSPWRVFTSVLFALWFRELKSRYGGKRLGWFWAFASPIVAVAIFTMLAGARGRDLMYGIDYPVFVLTGLIPFGIITHSITQGMGAVEGNAGLFIYRQVKPFDVIVGRVMQTVLIDTIILVVLALLGAWLGYRVLPSNLLMLCVLWTFTAFMALGLSLCMAVLAYRFDETKRIVPFVMRPLIFVSGVVAPLSRIPEEFQPWLTWNPIMHLLELIRKAWFDNFPLDERVSWWMVTAPTVVILALGMIAYRSHRHLLAAE